MIEVALITPLGYHAPDGVMITRTRFSAIVLSSLLALVLLAACGGDDGTGPNRPGQLTDPRSVPTASPWVQPPEVIILEPGAIKPLGGQQGGTPGAGGDQTTPGQCGKTYKVQEGDNPSLIAEKCGVELQALLDANPGLVPTSLQVGQELKLP